MVDEAVTAAVSALPAPAPGRDADPDITRRMVDEAVTAAVSALPAPVGVKSAMVDRAGNLIITKTDGDAIDCGAVIGKDADPAAIERAVSAAVDAIPKPQDGVGFDDIVLIQEGRDFTLKGTRGDREKVFGSFVLPVFRDAGVWKDGKQYGPGDGVTWRGSFWICQKETGTKPDEMASAWRLAVKRGRDGKDLRG
jgi:hypothetical protein